MSTLQPRLTALASTLAAGSALASAAMIGGVPMTPTHSPLFDKAHHNVGLVNSVADALFPSVTLNTDTFGGSLQWLLDNELKLGNVTLPNMVDPHSTLTLESLLAGSHLGTSSTMTDVFNQLGLDNFKLEPLMTSLGLAPGSSLDTLLDHLGLANLTVNNLMTDFVGFGTGETLAGLVDKIGMGTKTIGDLMGMVGLPATTTVDGLLNQLGVGELSGLLGGLGVGSTTDLGALLSVLGSGTSTLTLDDLLKAAPTSGAVTGDGVLSKIGDMTLGQMIGLGSATTLADTINDLKFGSTTLGSILELVKIGSTTTLGSLLEGLPSGSSGTLGSDTLGAFLGMLTGGKDTIDATTTMNAFLTDIGMGNLNLDDLLGLPTT
ncbi:hypothetical protein KIH27_09710 [Mycobacterium sp. M1]|uniref:Uncharacterized protein n=1 Tax=Mycolicibacter acidiphilus TaxID=2835306 RepID=A0ABS5RJS0_9MYCO|nr:hypothetical protein [Mycolicibacter acidiphilus]MBS9533859.1 hypothetical protein [Mycolicibacter acidiphilus]